MLAAGAAGKGALSFSCPSPAAALVQRALFQVEQESHTSKLTLAARLWVAGDSSHSVQPSFQSQCIADNSDVADSHCQGRPERTAGAEQAEDS